jgi:FMN-dependent NADH-azoreductase
MKILRIQSSPRGEHSEGRKLGDHLVNEAKRTDPSTTTIVRGRDPVQVRTLAGSEQLIAELESTDLLVIEVPLWNFSIPASLKAWFDQVLRARRTFRMSESGSEGLLKDRKSIVIMTTSGVSLGSGYDFATPYIRHILGIAGIKDVALIDAGSLNFEADRLEKARAEITAKLAVPLAKAA